MNQEKTNSPCKFHTIVAVNTETWSIGIDDTMPWCIKADLIWFRKVTMNGVVLMGRKTWESIGSTPLKHRINIVVSKTLQKPDIQQENLFVFSDLHDAMVFAGTLGKPVFVIGGESIYNQVLSSYGDSCLSQIVTRISVQLQQDDSAYKHYPRPQHKASAISKTYSDGTISFDHVLYQAEHSVSGESINIYLKALQDTYGEIGTSEEKQYKELLLDIIKSPICRQTRGIDDAGNRLSTQSVFGRHLTFDLSQNTLPLITMRRGYFKMLFTELMWLLSGSTDTNILSQKNIKVWEKNTTRQTLNSYGFNERPEGSIGPSYGFQLRYFGSDYDESGNHSGQGVDQLNAVIEGIKKDPYSRRHMISLWNAKDTGQMTLPPCLCQYQFLVDNEQRLSCIAYMRSSDTPCALMNWNIPQTALLTALIANHCDLKRGSLQMFVADAHIYSNQVEQIQTMLGNETMPFPVLEVLAHHEKKITDICFEDVKLHNYVSGKAIHIPMAV